MAILGGIPILGERGIHSRSQLGLPLLIAPLSYTGPVTFHGIHKTAGG